MAQALKAAVSSPLSTGASPTHKRRHPSLITWNPLSIATQPTHTTSLKQTKHKHTRKVNALMEQAAVGHHATIVKAPQGS